MEYILSLLIPTTSFAAEICANCGFSEKVSSIITYSTWIGIFAIFALGLYILFKYMHDHHNHLIP